MPLLVTPYDASHKQTSRVSSQAPVRYRSNDYSVPTQYGHQAVLVKGTVDWVDIYLVGKLERIARHRRSYAKADFVVNLLHYLALLEKKPRALDQAAPLQEWVLPALRATATSAGSTHGQARTQGIYPGSAVAGNLQYL
ncbi:hypothetical protein AAKU64_004366 [Undibacterium sp. GrIS 1.8]|uniref:Mu transposase domain-containing protein n=1 Tax=unclassified Undibacterium TaxID=2630295 RepID=UPI003393ECAA